MGKVHRWQITGYTTCGLKITDIDIISTNIGHALDNGVTCKNCKRATTRMSYLGEEWNGQFDGYPKA